MNTHINNDSGGAKSAPTNVDLSELKKFSDIAHSWWDPHGDFKPLHDLNPLRLEFIDREVGVSGKRILDVGCGGGILSESLAARGATVTGIDLNQAALSVAQLHLLESALTVDYKYIAVEELAQTEPAYYDVVTCMELLEHVPDPASIVNACARLVKPGGHIFFSTLNRNFKSYTLAVIGAEYVLNMLPRGTHDYEKFIKPSELARYCRDSGLHVTKLTGMHYNPLTQLYSLAADASVNYILVCQRND